MRRRWHILSAAAIGALPLFAHGAVSVEQIEAEQIIQGNDPNYSFEQYAPVEFGGSTTVIGTAPYAGITFHAVDPTNDTSTLDTTAYHAQYVAGYIYAAGTLGSNYVTNVYNAGALDFLLNNVNQYNTSGSNLDATGVNPLPGHFASGVQVVNNSWVANWATVFNNSNASVYNLPTIRRYDFMVNRDNVTSVVAASSGSSNPLLSASFNSLTVTGDYATTEAGSVAKQHADLHLSGQPSVATAEVSNDAVGLYGNAAAAFQTDAENSYVMRSLLIAGATHTYYSYPGGGSAGAMDGVYGAGEPNYDNSLAILQAGERTIQTVSSNAASGTPVNAQSGWGTNSIAANTSGVILFNSSNTITGINASLNWNVTSMTSGGNLNTTNAALIFPNLTLEVRPVSYNASLGKWVLGSSESDVTLHSSVSGDNTQYITSGTSLPAGAYALLATNLDSTYSAQVGLSYTLFGSFATRWNSSGGGSWGNASLWTTGIPNGQAAQANLLASPGITAPSTITLDGDRTVGQLTFNNSNGYTINQGTIPTGITGQLTLDDTGDSSGTANPFVMVYSGNQILNAPIDLASTVSFNISSNSSLTLNGAVAGNGALVKYGPGTLTLNVPETFLYGGTGVYGGKLVVGPGGATNVGAIGVYTGATLEYAANNGGGFLVRNVTVPLNINSSAAVLVDAASVSANRQLLVFTGGLSIAGTTNAWTGKLDLNNNDADIPTGNLGMLTNQILQGYNNGRWNGSGGILSSSASTNSTHLTALGIILNTTNGTTPLYSTGTTLGAFDGTSPGATDVLIKYTYVGDANLDGKVDGSDYSRIDNGVLMGLTGWYNGDFNYDGVINGSDYTLIDNAFNTQGAQISSQLAVLPTAQIASPASVPEPTTLAMSAMMTAATLRRRVRPARLVKSPTRFSA